MKKLTYLILTMVLALLIGLPILAVNAQSSQPAETATPQQDNLLGRLTTVAGDGGYQTDQNIVSTPIIVGRVIAGFLSFVGIIFIVLIIIAGYNWMTANGSEDKVEKSRDTIKQALIGVVITISSWAIWQFIFQSLIANK
jgi:quinol-cytochrome oxidoreductase complex cytochrome b subunit